MSNIAFIDLATQQKHIRAKIDGAITRVLDHGKYIMGPEIAEFEQKLAQFCGVKHAISCSSGTDALVLALLAKNIAPWDAVFVPDFTFPATPEAVCLLGATPVFVDVLENTFNMDPDHLKASIEKSRSLGLTPKGIMSVDLYGQPADYDQINTIAKENDLWVVGDAAQSFGGSLHNTKVGKITEITATSFFPAKPLGCYGDGGAVFTDDDELADRMKSLRVHGKGQDKYDIVRIGINGRLDTMQAAILLEKLAIFGEEIDKRQIVAERYKQGLHNVVKTPHIIDGATSAWAQYTILVENRDKFQADMKELGVPTAVYYPRPLSEQEAYRSNPTGPNGNPVSKHLSDRVVSLPMHPYLDEGTQEKIIDAVRKVTTQG
jgi:UDP-2-acetamido-2-deoxy-ribo-hexuluronate aminotransferase